MYTYFFKCNLLQYTSEKKAEIFQLRLFLNDYFYELIKHLPSVVLVTEKITVDNKKSYVLQFK